jgi:single-strand DNA-binding protein
MFETNICVVGNVLTTPEWRRTSASGRLVTTFKVAAATRRLDRTTGAWVDGNGLRVRVSCWRDLAGGVASSVMVGDPVVVYGQIYTRDWVDAEGNKRTLYEMEAQAVGHNLARGRARFARNKPVSASEREPDPDQPVRLGGEATEPVAGPATGLDPSDPLQQVDDASFGYTGDQPDPWDFSGADPVGGLLSGFGAAPVPGAEDDGTDDEDAEDEESADDAEAVEHRPEEDAGDETGEAAEPKARRRRRTPAEV